MVEEWSDVTVLSLGLCHAETTLASFMASDIFRPPLPSKWLWFLHFGNRAKMRFLLSKYSFPFLIPRFLGGIYFLSPLMLNYSPLMQPSDAKVGPVTCFGLLVSRMQCPAFLIWIWPTTGFAVGCELA